MITKKLYNKTAKAWIRNKPICLSDFTARKFVIKDLTKVKGKIFADLGCGEGYCSRQLVLNGAKKVVGIDISKQMISYANLTKNKKLIFLKRNICNSKLKSNSFDTSIAIFVFNYLKKKEIIKSIIEMKRITKKNGTIAFTVPHPMISFIKKPNNFFYFNINKKYNYFTAKGKKFNGLISKINGEKLKVQMYHHTLEDYFESLKKTNIKVIEEIKELKVNKDVKNKNLKMYNALKGLPLHIYFKLKNYK